MDSRRREREERREIQLITKDRTRFPDFASILDSGEDDDPRTREIVPSRDRSSDLLTGSRGLVSDFPTRYSAARKARTDRAGSSPLPLLTGPKPVLPPPIRDPGPRHPVGWLAGWLASPLLRTTLVNLRRLLLLLRSVPRPPPPPSAVPFVSPSRPARTF